MELKEGHRGIDDLTDEEAKQIALELYEEDCAEAARTETPPDYSDESNPIVSRILEDLEGDGDVVYEDEDAEEGDE